MAMENNNNLGKSQGKNQKKIGNHANVLYFHLKRSVDIWTFPRSVEVIVKKLSFFPLNPCELGYEALPCLFGIIIGRCHEISACADLRMSCSPALHAFSFFFEDLF